jgi:stage V sporulation protein B
LQASRAARCSKSRSLTATPSRLPATDASSDATRTAGRGGVFVLGAKVFFIVSGLLQQTLLPRFIGQATFGAFSRVSAVANVVNNVMIASATQGVSRAIARSRGHHEAALRVGLRLHAVIALVAAALFAASAPFVAWFERAPYIRTPLVAMAGVVACYGFYAALVGALNGTARFGKQAALDVTFAVLRTTGLLGMGWLFIRGGGDGVLGAALGFVVAAACIIPLALRWTGTGRAPTAEDAADVPHAGAYLLALAPIAVAQLFTNAVMQIDITLLGRFLSTSALAVDAGPKAADEWVGVYRECQLFAFLPYQLLFSVTQVLFPFVARAHAEGDTAAVGAYVARGARIGAIACGLMVAVIAAMPRALLALIFSDAIGERGEATLRVLALGQGAFALLGLAATVLVSLGRELEAAIITLVTLIVIAGGCFGFAPSRPFGGDQLFATATATSVGLALGLTIAVVRVTQVAGRFIPRATALRVALALGATVLVGTRLPRAGRLVTPLEAIALAAVYLIVMIATREIGREDLQLVTALVKRRATK